MNEDRELISIQIFKENDRVDLINMIYKSKAYKYYLY